MATSATFLQPVAEFSQARSNHAPENIRILNTFVPDTIQSSSMSKNAKQSTLASSQTTSEGGTDPSPTSPEGGTDPSPKSPQTNDDDPANAISPDSNRTTESDWYAEFGGSGSNTVVPFVNGKDNYNQSLGPYSNNPTWSAQFSGGFSGEGPNAVDAQNPSVVNPPGDYALGFSETDELKKTGMNGNPGDSAESVISSPDPGSDNNVTDAFDYVDYHPTGGQVSFTYGFSISCSPPNQGNAGLALGSWSFRFTAPGVSGSVQGNQLSVSYTASDGTTVDYTDPNFFSSGDSFSASAYVQNVPEGNADISYHSVQEIDCPNGRDGFDSSDTVSFSYHFSRAD